MILKTGNTGNDVALLQARLLNAKYLAVDTYEHGTFDNATARAVMDLQAVANLVIDAIVGPKTMSALLKRDTSHLLSESNLTIAASALGVDLATIAAVRRIESKHSGFDNAGRPKILYERHVMRRRLLVHGITNSQLKYHEQKHSNLVNRDAGGYTGGAGEWIRLTEAQKIHATSALESCSWGMFQIMGYHWKRLGYTSITDFVSQMEMSEGHQLDAFVRFVNADPVLKIALQKQEWAAFAKGYNGPGYRNNKYDTRLATAYTAALADQQATA